jgi:hypothetical protein
VTPPLQDEDLAEVWADLRSRRAEPRPWFEDLAWRITHDQVVTLVGRSAVRLATLDKLASVQKAAGEAVLLRREHARRWTFGQGAAETLREIFKEYASWSRGHGETVSPLIRDTILATGADSSRLTAPFREFLTPHMGSLGSHAVWQLTSEWIIGANSLVNTVSFLRQACALGVLKGAKLAFDDLENGRECNLKSLEKLLAVSGDCGTTLSFCLGWSGETEVLARIEAVAPALAALMKRTSFSLPKTT